MNPVYIRASGLHSEHLNDLCHLDFKLNECQEKLEPSIGDIYQSAKIKLSQSEIKMIAREDRSILNDLATSILNATGDMLKFAGREEGLDNAEETPLYSGTDGASEYSFTALGKLIDRFGSTEETMAQLGLLSGMTNPINMMRHLSTNPLYHTSKRLGLRGGGYPIRGMSLSGMYAIEDAVSDISTDRCKQGVVVAAGSLRNFDSLVVFGKMGLLGTEHEAGEVNPSYGSAVLLLDSDESQRQDALAQIISVSTRYNAEPFPSQDDWYSLLLEVKESGVTPETIVTYCNGVKTNDENELAAINKVFPNATLRNYKSVFGYTSKANNALDLIAVLSDKSVPVGTTILIHGSGFNVGIGYIVMTKLSHCNSPEKSLLMKEGSNE